MPSTIRIMQNKAIIFPNRYYILYYISSWEFLTGTQEMVRQPLQRIRTPVARSSLWQLPQNVAPDPQHQVR